jgi:hypothetical protein
MKELIKIAISQMKDNNKLPPYVLVISTDEDLDVVNNCVRDLDEIEDVVSENLPYEVFILKCKDKN